MLTILIYGAKQTKENSQMNAAHILHTTRLVCFKEDLLGLTSCHLITMPFHPAV